MSYATAFAGDARLDLAAMEPWLQEELLDELEMTAVDPSALAPSSADAELVYAFSRTTPSIRHYVAITLSRNDASGTLTILGIYHRSRPLTSQP